METPDKVEKLGDAEFKWGTKKGNGGKNKEVKFYKSFTYDGVEYQLYDCVYMHHKDENEPYIGKLVKIWESRKKSKMVKVHWFFRPSEILHWLQHHNLKASHKELFLASGEGEGLENINPLEAIAGKCNIVCISKDTRNPQPSRDHLGRADYVFHRTFDVGKCVISENFCDKVGSLEVEFVFNRMENGKNDDLEERAAKDLEGENALDNATYVYRLPGELEVFNKESKRRLDNGVDIAAGEMNSSAPSKNNVARDVLKDNEPLKGSAEFGKSPLQSAEDPSSLDNRPAKRTKYDGSIGIASGKGLVKDEKLSSTRDIFMTSAQDGIGADGERKLGENKQPMQAKKEAKLVKDSSTSCDGSLKKVKVHEGSPKAKNEPNLVESTIWLDGSSKKPNDLIKVKNPSSKEDNKEKNKATLDSPRLKDYQLVTSLSKDKCGEKNDMLSDSSLKLATCDETLMKKKSALNKSLTLGSKISKDAIIEGKIIEVTRRPIDDESKWFRLPPWEERLLAASDQRMLVLIQNLDPDCTSTEVEDIIWHAFQEKCSAKVIQRNAFSSPHGGQALIIFKTKEAAGRVVRKLNDGCLVLSNQRPLVGRIAVLPKNSGKQARFVGHLAMGKIRQQRNKDALSTSHCAQPNTIEHELAMEWCLSQARVDFSWKKIHKQQGAELKRLMDGLKSK